ncbi:hypothetical protein KBI23_03725 [bacterium]|nr:hypothetical protein [bacterium]MBP9810021.1 hypothetical protein [bacterium]
MMVGKKLKIQIPPPPAANATADELAAYFEKYGLDELEAAGYVNDLTKEELKDVEELGASCQSQIQARKGARTQLNLAMSSDQLDRFLRHASKKHIPPSTLAKAWILERLDQEAKEA